MKRTSILSLLVIAAALLSPSVSRADELPEGLLAAKAPKDAVSVLKARGDAKPGASIVVRGKIGGRVAALLPKAAIAVLADESAITPCNAMPGDACKTPWDYCCEDPAAIKASTATIQVRGENGKVVRATLRGLGELKELSTVVVAGTVDAASNKDVLIINATAIHVEKP